jgi:hypothetical protein
MPDFQDGDIIITEHFAVKVTKTGRGWFAEVVDSHHPMNGAYFLQLLREAGEASGDPRRRAMALGWTPPPPDTDGFWYHPSHGPVHEDDIEGVLRREADTVTAGADVTAEGVSVEVRSWPGASPKPEESGPIEYRARQPCECHLPKEERRFRQDAALEPQCVPCRARARLEQATSGSTGPS